MIQNGNGLNYHQSPHPVSHKSDLSKHWMHLFSKLTKILETAISTKLVTTPLS